jgi:hypothetical protein
MFVVVALVSVIGCSSGASSSPSASPSAAASASSTLTVLQQIAATSEGITAALEAYKGGRNNQAIELVNDAYLSHFEFVEGPLEAVDAELTERLEDKIREDLREKMTAGASIDEVTTLATEIVELLAQASDKLK